MSAAKFAAMTDEELFSPQTYWEGDADALKAEREKRKQVKAEELERLRERFRVLQTSGKTLCPSQTSLRLKYVSASLSASC